MKQTEILDEVDRLLDNHPLALIDPPRETLIQHSLADHEAIASRCGALATWTPRESTGRSPKDTYIVRRSASESSVDWDSPYCLPLEPETFEMLWQDALRILAAKPRLYASDRVVGADTSYALPVRTVGDHALHTLFTYNMFRPMPREIGCSCFADRGFTMLVLPDDKVCTDGYAGRLRRLPDGRTSNMAIVMDFDERRGLVYGSAYCGSIKKLMFTVMNYLLPAEGILPLHCSANEAPDGSTALLLGLSGTGKTSLSADPRRALLGDDEHGWSDDGIANFENGCYAKLVNLNPEKEREIHEAMFHEADPLEHGAIVENCLMFPDGTFDLDDTRLTPNSRGSYPLEFLTHIKTPPLGAHPKTMLFLTADANGVLPPVSRLTADQAMLWFLMGYTSKLAGTETGVVDPVTTFSRFFGEPFMAREPDAYATLLGRKLARHGTRVFLINTGWSGGPYGEGSRMDIQLTRAIVEAALSGKLDIVSCRRDPLFHFGVPIECPGVPEQVLQPRNTWKDAAAYDRRAEKLAREFATKFEQAYGKKEISPEIAAQCPGRR